MVEILIFYATGLILNILLDYPNWVNCVFSFITLSTAIDKLIRQNNTDIFPELGYMMVQGIIYLVLLILVDYLRTVYYKGSDGN